MQEMSRSNTLYTNVPMCFLVLRYFGTPIILDQQTTDNNHHLESTKGGIQLAYVTPAEDGVNHGVFFFVADTEFEVPEGIMFHGAWWGLQEANCSGRLIRNSHVMIYDTVCVVEWQIPSKIEWDRTNGPLSKLLDLFRYSGFFRVPFSGFCWRFLGQMPRCMTLKLLR